MRSLIFRGVAAALALIGLGGAAHAATEFYSFSWLGHNNDGDPGFFTDYFNGSFNSLVPTSSAVSGSATFADPSGDVTLSGFAKGYADYLHLGTAVSATLTNAHYQSGGGLFQNYDAAAVAGYKTQINIFGPSLVQSDIYTRRFTYRITGGTDFNAGDAHGFLYFQLGSNGAEGGYFYNGADYVTATYQFQPGVATDYQVEFDSDWTIDSRTVTPGTDAYGAALFFHTLTLSDVEVLDSHGQPVTDFQVVDANNGRQIFGGGTFASSAPEPGSLLLLALGGAATLAARRRRRGRS